MLKNKKKLVLGVTLILAAMLVVLVGSALAQNGGNPDRGGLLYDKWWRVTGADEPTEVQPLWIGDAESAGDTWRCQACHGWFYTGDANYPGLLDLAGTDPAQILDALKGKTNADHDFSTVMSNQDLMDLASFISEKVYDTSAIVDADNKPVNGDAAAGEATFAACATCHGPEGLAINFHHDEAEPPEYIPTIATDDPGEFLSKAHWGQPGHPEMPAGDLLGFTTQDYANLLAYLQQFPTSSPLTEGGQMYDNWWKTAVVSVPEGDMPLWSTQTNNTRSGADTWRCKECHGWDYKGVDGVYGSGSHMTGFPGIWDAQNKSADEILAALTGQVNPDHDFSKYLNADRLNALVVFIQTGLVDKSEYINGDKSVNGDVDHGKALFNSTCARCHDADGLAINFHEGTDEPPEFVGTVAADNPWEFFNKASMGQPGEAMPAGLNMGWSWQDIADLAAYAKTLPTEAQAGEVAPAEGDVVRGGKIYDHWSEVVGMDPEGEMPLWATQTTNTRTGNDTWRCKECHGWDYKGVDGAYGSGSHMTGFPGVWDMAGMPVTDIIAWLDGTNNADHDFSPYFSQTDLVDAATFLSKGLVDYSIFADPQTKAAKGDAAAGEALFQSVCALCHGADGTQINFGDDNSPEYVGTVATENPWELLHKVHYGDGDPAAGMPAAMDPTSLTGAWTQDDIANVVAYAQTLPTGATVEAPTEAPVVEATAAPVEQPTEAPAPAEQSSNSGLIVGAIVLVLIIVGGVVWYSRKK